MAATYSDGPAARAGGDLGYFHRNELMPAIETAAFSINAGDISEVIQTPAGFHIIKVLDKDTKEEDRTWQDREGEIRASLYNRQFQDIYDQWLAELQERSHIKINF
jgi:parvulin-like peptidyl-prolyl isomerase